ncbi:PhoH family protein [bacterium]|nr:PhoH family protein [bacterium]
MKSAVSVTLADAGVPEDSPEIVPILQRATGPLGRNLTLVEELFGVRLRSVPGGFQIDAASTEQSDRARDVLKKMMRDAARGRSFSQDDVRALAGGVGPEDKVGITITGKLIQPKTRNQKAYVEAIRRHDLTLAIGPAGTGKTYLAVATALEFLREGKVKRIILTRPVVEAGERLGYLPGGYQEKINPYLRPLFDAMFDQLTPEKFMALLEKQIIEMAPLAYMRGRTFNDAFVILDEAQNTTPPQMLMFLTRMGADARIVVTGDVTQTDLPPGVSSGLVEAARRLKKVDGIAICGFDHVDVIRHRLVTRILRAFDGVGSPRNQKTERPARRG